MVNRTSNIPPDLKLPGLAVQVTGRSTPRSLAGAPLRARALRFGRSLGMLSLLLVVWLPGCSRNNPRELPSLLETTENLRERLEASTKTVASDSIERTEAVLDGALPSKLRLLKKSILNLELPSAEALPLFADAVEVVDVAAPGEARALNGLDVKLRDWSLASHSSHLDRSQLQIWRSFLGDVSYFRHAKFLVIRGNFVDPDERRINAELKFEGLARVKNGYLFAKAKISVEWLSGPEKDFEVNGLITKWVTKHFETQEVRDLLFADVLKEALDDSLYTAVAERSAWIDMRIAQVMSNRKAGRTHEDLSAEMDDTLLPYTRAEIDAVLTGLDETGREFVRLFYGRRVQNRALLSRLLKVSRPSLRKLMKDVNRRLNSARRDQRPAVVKRIKRNRLLRKELQDHLLEITETEGTALAISVTDIDADGFDDIFVGRGGRNYLLRNRGDATFEDFTAKVDLPQGTRTVNAALFVDTDNDDDVDLFLGLRDELRYYINENGRFVNRTKELIDAYQPRGRVAMSAADYDGDGLIDVYVQTRDLSRPAQELMSRANLGVDDGKLHGHFLPEAQARRFYRRAMSEDADAVFNRPAPPNMLLGNLGDGKFAIAPDSEHLELYSSTHYAAWGDYDNDGDPDLYVSNDFGPNNLFRNDNGVLVDVTDETGTADVGFGMGVTWGDYDNDGDQDLYVTNMYSKAGLRITSQAGLKDTRAHIAAHGNTLFRNDGNAFAKVSGEKPPWLTVEPGGWGWGAQFIDIDNDGFLDIYAPSGNISTPPGLEELADT